MGTPARTAEEELDRLASAGHGVVTRGQLLDAGLSRKQIAARVRKGALIRVHRGVYRVGHRAPSAEASYLAAVLAGGDGALLSGRAAAHLLGLVKGQSPPPEIITRTERRIEGVRTHRSRAQRLGAAGERGAAGDGRDGTVVRGIPVTTVPRTLVDISSELSSHELARACHEAGVRYGTTPKSVEAVLARRPSSPGARRLRRVLSGDVHVTLSVLEAHFLELLRDAGLPLPRTNKPAGGRRVDCRWPEQRLTVELDSYRFHNSRYSWEQDRRREREARARGDEFRRYSYGDVFERPALMLREMAALIGAPPPPPPRSRSETACGAARRAARGG